MCNVSPSEMRVEKNKLKKPSVQGCLGFPSEKHLCTGSKAGSCEKYFISVRVLVARVSFRCTVKLKHLSQECQGTCHSTCESDGMRSANEDFSRTLVAVNHIVGTMPLAPNILETSYYF